MAPSALSSARLRDSRLRVEALVSSHRTVSRISTNAACPISG
jgi:hypothetical protein